MSLELNVIETNWFFLQKEGVNRIVLRYKIGTQSDWKSPKRGSSPRNLPTMPKYGSTHPRPCELALLLEDWLLLEIATLLLEIAGLINQTGIICQVAMMAMFRSYLFTNERCVDKVCVIVSMFAHSYLPTLCVNRLQHET